MSGRAKIQCFQYDENGKYLRSYDSISEVREKYYSENDGQYPFFVEKNYQKLPDGTFIANYRIGRNNLLKQEKINNCEFCTDRKFQRNEEVEVYNLKDQKIAKFKNAKIASLLLNVSLGFILNKVRRNSAQSTSNSKFPNLIFKKK